MTPPLRFNAAERPRTGVIEEVAPGVRRLVAGNQGPYTFTGTNSYIIGEGRVAVIDPGPDDAAHLARLVEALTGETVSHILVTHTHLDHVPLASPLARRTGAEVIGFAGPAGRPGAGEGGIGAGPDAVFAPHVRLGHGDAVAGPGWTLRALHTPGHAPDHLCFALEGTGILFSGDHVMGWSTSVVAPPGGEMGAYLASLDLLAGREDTLYLPGHGAPVRSPGEYVGALARHRMEREAGVRAALGAGPASAREIAGRVYAGLEPRLMRAARLTTLAHLIHLADNGEAEASGDVNIDTTFRAKE